MNAVTWLMDVLKDGGWGVAALAIAGNVVQWRSYLRRDAEKDAAHAAASAEKDAKLYELLTKQMEVAGFIAKPPDRR